MHRRVWHPAWKADPQQGVNTPLSLQNTILKKENMPEKLVRGGFFTYSWGLFCAYS